MSDEKPRATLTDRQARGGVIGGKGYGFQAAYIVSRIPIWLDDPDFAQFLQEGAGDVDVRFNRANGEERRYVQVKNYAVTPATARKVFSQFRDADAGTPGTYTRFTLACPGLSDDLKRLRSAVEELRGAAPFYRPGQDEILDNTWADLESLVEKLDLPVDVAFLVDRVDFDTNLAGLTDDESLCNLFVGSLLRLEAWARVAPEAAARAYGELALLCHRALRQTCSREQVVALIREAMGLKLSDLCPYQGLAAFTEADTEFFFGREKLVGDLVDHLRGSPRFLAVVGPSGSGKSSVVQAGLFPALCRGEVPGSADWYLLTFRPGDDPFAALSTVGLPQEGDLQTAVRAFLETNPQVKRLVLFVDQFEELFTLCPGPVQKRFLSQLLAPLESNLRATVILALRADFYGHLLRYRPPVNWLKIGQVNVPPMGPGELTAAVKEPAGQVGLRFEPGLVQTIVEEAGEADHPLPLLEAALTQLWEKREDGVLTHAAYQAVGQVAGAIGQWAEDCYSGLTQEEQSLARRVFTRLVHYGEGEVADTGQQQSLSALVTQPEEREPLHRLVRRLADARLLVTGGDPGAETVEIIHDALLQQWGRLKHWTAEQREFYLWRQRLDERLQEWEEKGQDEGALLRGALLAEAERWLAEQPDDLNPGECEYIQESVARRELEQATRERLRRRVILGLTVGLIVTIALALAVWMQRNAAWDAQAVAEAEADGRATAEAQAEDRRQQAEAARVTAVAEAHIRATAQAQAEERRQIALSRQLAAQSASELNDNNYDTALLLAIEAGRIAHTAEAYGAIRQILANPWRTAAILSGHTGSARMAAWNADGSQVLTVDGTVRVWEARTGVKLLDLSSHAMTILQAVWNADGSRILTAGCDRRNESNSECLEGTARVWDAETGDELLTLSGHTDRVVQASWNANESRVLTVGEDGTARVWDVETGVELLDLSSDGVTIWQAVWNADGGRILTAGDDDKARVYNAETGAELHTLAGGVAAWNADGSRILTAGDDGKARVWDVETGDELLTLSGHTDRVVQASWNADESRILTASRDGTARVWEADTGDEILYLPQYMLRVDQAVWNRDGSLILVNGCVQYYPTVFGCQVKMARVWNAENGAELLALTGQHSHAGYAKWSPDGTHILTIDNRDVVRIWNVTGRGILTLTGHAGTVRYATWNGDGSRILTAGDDGTARLWDIGTSHELPILGGYADRVTRAMWNADESLILTTSWNFDKNENIVGTARVWNAKTGDELLTLSGHTQPIEQAEWNADENRILTAGDDGKARVWDARTGEELFSLPGSTAAWNADGSRILTVFVSTAKVWNAETETQLFTLSGHWYPISRASWSSDGFRILTSSYGEDDTRVWDARTGEELFSLPGGIAVWETDGSHIVTFGADGVKWLWDVDTSPRPLIFSSHPYKVDQAAWNSDQSRILTICSDNAVRVLDGETGDEILTLSGHTGSMLQATWNPDDSRVLTVGEDGRALIWDSETGSQLLTLPGHTSELRRAFWSADGSRVLTAGDRSTAQVWDAQTGERLVILSGHTDRVVHASWNADGSRILTASWDGTVRQWHTRMEDLLEAACHRAPRNMVREEWTRLMGERPYRATCPNLPVPGR